MQRPNQMADFLTKRIDSPETNRRIDSNRQSECSSFFGLTITVFGLQAEPQNTVYNLENSMMTTFIFVKSLLSKSPLNHSTACCLLYAVHLLGIMNDTFHKVLCIQTKYCKTLILLVQSFTLLWDFWRP